MTIKRKRRFVRDEMVRLQLTERDTQILKLVFRNRFLSSDHIVALLGHNRKSLLRRLYLMFHAGYLDRPKAQILAIGNNTAMVYALGNRGAQVLAGEYGDPSIAKINWTEKNKNSKGMFLEHTLMVAEFLTLVQMACRKVRGVDYISAEEIIGNRILPPSDPAYPLSWKIKRQEKKRFSFSIIPDGAFGLKITDEKTGHQQVYYYFLEADRATMPVFRHSLIRSSIYKKIVGYTASRDLKLFSRNFGFKKVFILTVTLSDERIKNMVKLNQEIHPKAKGYRMFKFSNIHSVTLEKPEMILGLAWINGQGSRVNLIA